MQTKKFKVSSLRASEYNPRKISAKELAKLKESIQEFGYVQPVIWNKQTNTIVGGHQRVRAMLDLGMGDESIDVVVVDLSPEREQALNVALNRISGEWDKKLLGQLLQDMDEQMRALSGFDEEEISKLIDAITEKIDPEDDNNVPDVTEQTDIQPGDVFQLGSHRLMCGSATDFADVEKLMGGAMANMVFTDPPYNVNYEGGNGLKIENDNMENADFYQFLLDAFTNMHTFVVEGGGVYIAHADSEGLNFRKAFIDAGFMCKQCIIWVKNSMVLGRQDYQWQHEPILYGWKEGKKHAWYGDFDKKTVIDDNIDLKSLSKPQLIAMVNKMRNGDNTTIVRVAKPSANEQHPTMKPLALVEHFVRNSSKLGDVILDLFGGSGSTLIVAESLGRSCYTMELDPRYCDVIIRRWEQKTGEKAKKIC